MAEQAKVPAIRFAGFTDPWEQRKFSNLTDRVSMQSSDPDLPQVEYEDIVSDEGTLNKDLRDKEGGKTGIKFYAGDVLYGKLRPYLMNWLYPQFNGVAVGDFWVLRATECDSSFLYRLVQTDSFQRLANVSSGSKMPRADWNLISQSFFAVPADYAEQRVIAKSLAELDDLITLHQRKYDKLVILKKSMLEKMFPKDGESVPEIRFAGFTDPWEQRKFVDFVEASGIRNKDNLQLESYSVSNDRGFVPQDEQFENGGTMRDADKTAYWIVEPGSFAYNPARINVGSIGYQSTRKNVIVSSLYEVFKTDRSCDDRFLWHWFKSSLFTKQIEMLQEGGVRLYFFFDKLQKSEIWMPNVDEQRIIGQQFDQLDSLITLHQRKLELLQNIKKSLLDKMFV